MLGGLVDVDDIGRDVRGAAGCLRHVAGDFLGGGALFLDGRGNAGGDLVDGADGAGDGMDGGDGLSGRSLDGGDLAGDLVGCLRGLGGELLDLGGNDRETLAGFASARRLDGGVERQKIGLAGDIIDELDDIADGVGGLGEELDLVVGGLCLLDRPGDHGCRIADACADLGNRA